VPSQVEAMKRLADRVWLLRSAVAPTIVAAMHLGLCVFVWGNSIRESAGSWDWFPLFVLDLPLSLTFPSLQSKASNVVLFGGLGTLWWFVLVWMPILFFTVARRHRERLGGAP
jgi:hypothetical protein